MKTKLTDKQKRQFDKLANYEQNNSWIVWAILAMCSLVGVGCLVVKVVG